MKTIKKLPYIFFAALYLCLLCACSTAPKEDDVQSRYESSRFARLFVPGKVNYLWTIY